MSVVLVERDQGPDEPALIGLRKGSCGDPAASAGQPRVAAGLFTLSASESFAKSLPPIAMRFEPSEYTRSTFTSASAAGRSTAASVPGRSSTSAMITSRCACTLKPAPSTARRAAMGSRATRWSTPSPVTAKPSMLMPFLPMASAAFTSAPGRSAPRSMARSFAVCIAESSPRRRAGAPARGYAAQVTLARQRSRVASCAMDLLEEASPSYRLLFTLPGFTRLVASMLLGRIGGTMVPLILLLFALDRYHSATVAGAVAFLPVAPGLAGSPIAGALLDPPGPARRVLVAYLVAPVAPRALAPP